MLPTAIAGTSSRTFAGVAVLVAACTAALPTASGAPAARLPASGAAGPTLQRQRVPVDLERVRRALEYLERTEAETLEWQVTLCEIPAPPFAEERRAVEYRRRFEDLGLGNVRIDAEGNVLGELVGGDTARAPGAGGPSGSGQTGSAAPDTNGDGELVVVLSAHLDTVFPEGTDVRVRRQDGLLHGPGIGDDCRGLAVVLAVARAMLEHELAPAGTLIFVGTVGEEGPGNLRGVRHLFEQELAGRVDHFISIDGTGLGITRTAVGSHRYEVTYTGPGGHSWGAFGMPNPIHALGRAIAKVADLEVPRDPKTTLNVGLVEGGTSVNSIAFATTMTVDLRSVDAVELDALDARFRSAIQEGLEEERARWPASEAPLDVEIASIGVRPAGSTAVESALVQAALAAGEELGFEPELGAGSTDSNLPMSLGIPAITIDGGGRGSGAHSLQERFDPTDSHLGAQWAFLLAATLTGAR